MSTLKELEGSRWQGKSELWLDPLGNKSVESDCTMEIGPEAVSYTWSYEGKPHTGRIALRADGADFTDTFHSPKPMSCSARTPTWCLLDVFALWSVGEGPDWGWRIYLSQRSADELVLQMSIVKPSGEDGRAVRMICKRVA